ncbi:expressed unknown protein [Seminavis robusta]|uniref:Uncharacterized protein n=1 Tax=Seminavis robusta TaxID=568900 RepID=A0A9N8EC95_9STRA|nr:expressed unknown protein [Seminavis robusta]|eukprot:Sro912_g219370.1 n/a (233) ;mRNA; r:39464-40162
MYGITNDNNDGFVNTPTPVSDESSSEDETLLMEEGEQGLHARRRVTFSQNLTHVHEIPARNSFSLEEKRAIWLSREEKDEFRRDAYAIVEVQSREGGSVTDETMRGLECRTHQGFELAKNNRARASFCVIDEQDRQDEANISCDPNLIAEVCKGATLHCRCVAYAQGLLDAQAALAERGALSFNQALARSIQHHLLIPESMCMSSTGSSHGSSLQGKRQEADDMDWDAVVDA